MNRAEKHHETAENAAPAKAEKVNVGKLEAEAEASSEAAKFSSEVADLGIDSTESAESSESGEGYSEGKGNKKDYSAPKRDQAKTKKDLKSHIHKTIPTRTMKKEVEREIRKEIRKEERKILLAYAGVKKYPPHKLAEMVSRMRQLKDLLSSIVDATKEVLTGLYLKWVRKEV